MRLSPLDRPHALTRALTRALTLALTLALACASSGVARADRFEDLSKDPRLTRVRLVTESVLARHDLPPTQRSYLHLALRGDLLLYYNSEMSYFLGIGAPMLSYGPLRWRSLTLWLNPDMGAQLETALSFVVYQSPTADVSVGVHGGMQGLKTYRPETSEYIYYDGYYDGDSYYDPYNQSVRVDEYYYGLNARYNWSRIWLEMSFDVAEVSQNYRSRSLEVTRLGLAVGFAL